MFVTKTPKLTLWNVIKGGHSTVQTQTIQEETRRQVSPFWWNYLGRKSKGGKAIALNPFKKQLEGK